MRNDANKVRKIPFYLFGIFLTIAAGSYAHEDHHRGKHSNEIKKTDVSNNEKRKFENINEKYRNDIKPIFKNKCMNCHSSQTNYPFYYNWPIAHGLISGDIEESKKHVNMDNDFPFAGHGTPIEDLEAIRKDVTEGTMPPLRYRLMHWGAALTDQEKQSVLDWVDESILQLKAREN